MNKTLDLSKTKIIALSAITEMQFLKTQHSELFDLFRKSYSKFNKYIVEKPIQMQKLLDLTESLI
jgi:hypothetical protein